MVLFSCIIYFSYNLVFCLDDLEFVTLIKNMAIKNHNDPTIFEKVYQEATTIEAKQQKYITNQFYECIFHNKEKINTKQDINTLCGHFIKFK